MECSGDVNSKSIHYGLLGSFEQLSKFILSISNHMSECLENKGENSLIKFVPIQTYK